MTTTTIKPDADELAATIRDAHAKVTECREEQRKFAHLRNLAALVLYFRHGYKIAELLSLMGLRNRGVWYNDIHPHAPDTPDKLPHWDENEALTVLTESVQKIKALAQEETSNARRRISAVHQLSRLGYTNAQIARMSDVTRVQVGDDLRATPEPDDEEWEWAPPEQVAEELGTTAVELMREYNAAKLAGEQVPQARKVRSTHTQLNKAEMREWWRTRSRWLTVADLTAYLSGVSKDHLTYHQVYYWLRTTKNRPASKLVGGRVVYDKFDAELRWRTYRQLDHVHATGRDDEGWLTSRALAELLGVHVEQVRDRIGTWRRAGALPQQKRHRSGAREVVVYNPCLFLPRWFGDRVWNAAVELARRDMPAADIASVLDIPEGVAEYARQCA
ncbi:hypothetical protein [Thermobispora bispora]|uniref:hypothetical protein n=1 Tax=Thermobispora bispora TaxID=2006 RepID=UPI00197CDA00|nr:hypothetical protein [Thermobispora bispora]QSI49933.1 hypothetical protein CYL17_18300 [Thermobispora bispora]QSI50035.1 hypothetical protein CYL17_18870 [Thermobispora bispora]